MLRRHSCQAEFHNHQATPDFIGFPSLSSDFASNKRRQPGPVAELKYSSCKRATILEKLQVDRSGPQAYPGDRLAAYSLAIGSI